MADCSIIPDGKDWVDMAQAFVPIILSIFALVYTGLQYKLAIKNRGFELFDRRYALYNRLLKWVEAVNLEKGFTSALHNELALILREGQFLFGATFVSLIEEIDLRFRALANWKREGKAVPVGKIPECDKPAHFDDREFFSKLPLHISDELEPYLKEGGIK